MERRILQPEQIIVPGEYALGNKSILNIYFRVFDRGHGDDLPPVIVARCDVLRDDRQSRLESVVQNILRWRDHTRSAGSLSADEHAEERIKEVRDAYEIFLRKVSGSEWYLLDGNHRTAAATLTHNPVYALDLQNSKDLAEVRRMIKRGELFDFKRPETSLRKLVLAFEEYLLGDGRGNDMHIEDCRTVRERIDSLTSIGYLPRYMEDRYLRGR